MDSLAQPPASDAAIAPPDTAAAPPGTAPEPALPLTPEQLAAQAAAEAEAAARAAAEAEAAEREAQLQRLLERMHKNADFPSLKDSIRGIQKVARSESAHLRALTDEVLGDVALSNKLLRMINTAFYSSVGGGTISSLQRAVALMGFQPVGMLATSLTLFDKLPKGPNGDRVREEFSRALRAAMLANQFCPVRRLEESAYISAMFQNLGTMLAWMHFPEEAAEVEKLLSEMESPDHEALQTASRQVLGMGYDDLAIEVARLWGWPESLQLNLRRLEPSDPEQACTDEEYLRVVCTAANRLAAKLPDVQGEEAMEACLAEFRGRYGIPLGLAEEELPGMVERAQTQWADLSLVLGFRKLAPPPVAKPAASKGREADMRGPASRPGPAARPEPEPVARRRPPPPARPNPAQAAALSQALESVSQLVMSQAPLNDVLSGVMNQLRGALDLQRVIVCLNDAASGSLVGRVGVGDRAMKLAPQFRVPMNPPVDLFGLLCGKEADTLISDTADPVISQRLPPWFRQYVQAPTFLLLPLSMGGRPLGLIYGDKAEAHALRVDDSELTLLKALRNQLLMAMRLRGIGG
jgi:HD-like signal output (HDOD) protein